MEYLKLLKLHKHRKRAQYEKKKIGIRADRPNQIWHADVTVFRTLDNIRAFIYFVVCNFTRYILSYRVSLKLSGQIMKENLVEAYEKLFCLPAGRMKIFSCLWIAGRRIIIRL